MQLRVFRFGLLCLCSVSVLFLLCLLFSSMDSPQCVGHISNQSLHRLLNSAPVNSLILRSPDYYHKKYPIVLLVISALDERATRDEIRRQWASPNESQMQKEAQSLVVFVVGRSSSLDEEAATHRDVLQVDVDETYRNLVHKIGVSFRWVKENIRSDFVVKVDSDTVVHIDRLYTQLQRKENEERGDWFACNNLPMRAVKRDKCQKWYISELDYPFEYIPPACRGAGYAVKRTTFDKIVVEIEDVFFTGIAADDLVHPNYIDDLVAHPYTEYSICNDDGPILSMLSTHMKNGVKEWQNLTTAWQRLKRPFCHDNLSKRNAN